MICFKIINLIQVNKVMKVVVVGAGIIGTSTAVRIRRQFPQCDLSIVASTVSPDPSLTSDISAGWWEPHLDPDTDPGLVTHWSAETYSLLATLASGQDDADLGPELSQVMRPCVRSVIGTLISAEVMTPPQWSSAVSGYKTLSSSDINNMGLSSDADVHGHTFDSYSWPPSLSLPLFYKWLTNNGVIIEQRRVDSLSDIDADIIVNCSGLGSVSLVNDQNMFPISGAIDSKHKDQRFQIRQREPFTIYSQVASL